MKRRSAFNFTLRKSQESGMVLPLVLMICSLLALSVLALQHTVTQQIAPLQAHLDALRQREWAWVGLQAALTDIHAPRGGTRHPADPSPNPEVHANPSLSHTLQAIIPANPEQWQRWWAQQPLATCLSGICTELPEASQRQTWLNRTDGVALPIQAHTDMSLDYWIEPLLLQAQASPASAQLVFRITVRAGPQIWQAWWQPSEPLSTPDVQGQWLSLLNLEEG